MNWSICQVEGLEWLQVEGLEWLPARLSAWLARIAVMNVATLYLVVGCLAGLPLVLLTPPFQVPDEAQHLYRAYQISELSLRATVQDGESGAVLPSSLADLAERFLGPHGEHTHGPVVRTPLPDSLAALGIPLDPTKRRFVAFSNTAFYSPLPYLPQVAAIAAGRVLGLGPLGLLYAARLANALAALVTVAFALRLQPVGRMAMFVVGLLPMVLFEFASVSPDAATIASAFLFTSIMMRARFCPETSTAMFGVAFAAGAVFCSLKPVYAPILMIGVPGAARRPATRRSIMVHAALPLAVTSIAVLWLAYAAQSMVAHAGADTSRQLADIALRPLGFAATIGRTLRLEAVAWIRSMIGQLGWLDIPPPTIMYVVPVAATLACGFLPRSNALRLSGLETAWIAVLLLGSSLLVLVALYLTWTSVGSNVVRGVQGRYFLPLAGLAATTMCAALPSVRMANPALARLAIIAFTAAEAVMTDVLVVHAYELV